MSITVSIVDDNPSLRKSISQLINGSETMECIGVYSCVEDALQGLRVHTPDVVLMDIELPKLNGIEGTRIVKDQHPDIDIIMLTVFADAERIFQSIRAGASGYLLKKTEPGKILDAITDITHGGSPMTSSVARIVMNTVRGDTKREKDAAEQKLLTEREYQILTLIMDGKRYAQIAESLFISVDTVRSHIRRIYEKLQVHSKTEALAEARKRGVL